MPKVVLCVALYFLGFLTGYAQNPYIDAMVAEIYRHQVTEKSNNYNAGMFPSQRIYLSKKKPSREDDNIFFTGLIVWTLKSIRNGLSSKNQSIVDAISAKATANYFRYQNKDAKPVYNFWQTNPSRHFPNSRYFSSRKKYIIPDDLDDTAILYLSADFPDSLKAIVRQLIVDNANGQKRQVRNTLRRYKKIPAYSTWFGKNMPVDFDICVQANGLMFVLDHRQALNKYDSATIKLIAAMVKRRDHLRRPAYVSPHYQRREIILYHLARLVAAHPEHQALSELKPGLIHDIKKQLQQADNGMERVLLQTSLLRLHEPPGKKTAVTEEDMAGFYFFVANMTSVFPNPVKGIFANSRKTNFFYRSKAYYLALLLENEMLEKRFID